ncbi:MAG: hypothetical protein OJF58_001155 [Enhydrobacter sp.]|nr:MAG: hypothetical protein OJF58_001155 [Enhydrobacter sp.]
MLIGAELLGRPVALAGCGDRPDIRSFFALASGASTLHCRTLPSVMRIVGLPTSRGNRLCR